MRTVNGSHRGGKLLPENGRRVEAFMRAAMARSDRVRSVSALAEVAHVQRQTIYNIWWGHPPKPSTVEELSHALGESPGAFWAAWEGRDQPSDDMLRALVEELRLGRREQLEMNRAIAAMLGTVARAVDRLAPEGTSPSGRHEDDEGVRP